MKAKSVILALVVSLGMLSSCQPGDDSLESKKKKLDELISEREKIAGQIAELEAEIALLDTTGSQEDIVNVEVSPVKISPFAHYVKVQGQVESENDVMVSAKMPGSVTSVLVEEGQKVSRGQLLATLDASVMQSSLAELQSQHSLAKTLHDKQKRLWDQKIGTEMQYLEAKNRMDALANSMATLRQQIAQTRITAPISGVVDMVELRVGSAAAPGVPAFRITNQKDLVFKAAVSETYVSKIHKGDAVQIEFPSLGSTVEAKVANVSETINPVNRTVEVSVNLPKNLSDLRSNMTGELSITDYSADSAVVLLQNYVQQDMEDLIVYLAREEAGQWRAEARKVRTGKSYNGNVEVLSGLRPGDLLISVGQLSVKNGSLLNVTNPPGVKTPAETDSIKTPDPEAKSEK